MRVLVFGGYSFTNRDFIFSKLAILKQKRNPTTIIRSKFGGANQIIGNWLQTNAIIDLPVEVQTAPADTTLEQALFDKFLALNPDGCVIFPGGVECDNLFDVIQTANISVWDLRRFYTALA